MKTLKTITTAIFISLSLLSCSSDDDSTNEPDMNENNTPEPNNTEQQITIEDVAYPIDKGIFEDLGTDDSIPGFYNADIYISNGEIINSTEDGTEFIEFDEDSEIVFASDLFSLSTENFEPGTFQIVESLPSAGDQNMNFAFETFIDLIDQDGNSIEYEATSGTVNISMNDENNYTVIVDAEFDEITINDNNEYVTVGSSNISFTFTGDFTFSDQRGE